MNFMCCMMWYVNFMCCIMCYVNLNVVMCYVQNCCCMVHLNILQPGLVSMNLNILQPELV
jgi:hypothetical protein